MTRNQPQRPRSSLAVWLVVAISLPILYVLGLGPAVWLFEHGYLTSAVMIVYSPLDSLHTNLHDTLFGKAITWYVDLWR